MVWKLTVSFQNWGWIRTMNNSKAQIINIFKTQTDFTLIAHRRPDGDTLGCCFALKHALELLGKRACVICCDEISPRYRFLTDGKGVLDASVNGCIVCVDLASPEMAGEKYKPYAERADIVIDHHPSNKGYGKVNLICPLAAATGEIIYEIIVELCPIDSFIADCLYTAISTDTGCFVYGNTTEASHKIAAKLINAGANIKNLNKNLFRTKTKAAFEIERQALDSLEYFNNATISTMLISLDMLLTTGASEDDIENLSSIPITVEGVAASATFRQLDKEIFKVSLRTNGVADASVVALSFGGGGHKMAAGCTLTGDYSYVKNLVVNELIKQL